VDCTVLSCSIDIRYRSVFKFNIHLFSDILSQLYVISYFCLARFHKRRLNLVLLGLVIFVFRSTPKSRPNNMSQMSVRPYVRPQKVFPIPMKFGMQVEVDE